MVIKRSKIHPALWLNRIIASPIFIVCVNAVFVGMVIEHIPEEKLDLTMSWATMLMDQLIISAGWVVLRQQNKNRKDDRALILRMARQIEAFSEAEK